MTIDRLELPANITNEPKGMVTLDEERVKAKIEWEKDRLVISFDSVLIENPKTLKIPICSTSRLVSPQAQ